MDFPRMRRASQPEQNERNKKQRKKDDRSKMRV